VGSGQLRRAKEILTRLGGQVIAPCPGNGKCPLPAEDWCHFTARVSRSRLHKQLKGGDAPYEDEKFSFLAVAKEPGSPAQARVLRHPMKNPGYIGLRLCTEEGVVDTTNVGAIFRSAAALNVDIVLVTPTCCDPLNRRAVRVSMGTVFQVPWTRIGETAEDWPHPGLDRLKALGFKTAAMALSDVAVSVDDPALMAEEKLAIVLGTEGDGLSKETIADCDYTVCIPMSHEVDSLNVAAASAVAFWQLRSR